jgi:hypothetical protein
LFASVADLFLFNFKRPLALAKAGNQKMILFFKKNAFLSCAHDF